MASERVEWFLQQVEAFNVGDIEGYLDALHPQFEFTPDPSFPDSSTYRGEEVRGWLRDWFNVWDQARLEVLETEEVETVLIADSRWHLVLTRNAGELPVEDFAIVVQFDAGGPPARRMWAFFDRDLALEKADELTG